MITDWGELPRWQVGYSFVAKSAMQIECGNKRDDQWKSALVANGIYNAVAECEEENEECGSEREDH